MYEDACARRCKLPKPENVVVKNSDAAGSVVRQTIAI